MTALRTCMWLLLHTSFFLPGKKPGSALLQDGRVLALYCTEQWQTAWFSRSFPYAIQAATIFDLNLRSAAAFRSIGVARSLYAARPIGTI